MGAPSLAAATTALTSAPTLGGCFARASASSKRFDLRQRLSKAALTQSQSVWDPLSARMAEDLGYRVLVLAGSTASAVLLGSPDLALATLSEVTSLVRRICRLSGSPLVVDCDHGLSRSALGVVRCVQEMEGAGAAGIMIEDTELPARFDLEGAKKTKVKGTAGGVALLPTEEAVRRLRAACEARSEGLLIFGRTSAHCLAGRGELLARLKAMKEACAGCSRGGLDGFVIIGPDLGEDDWAEINGLALDLPILVGGGLHKKEPYAAIYTGRRPDMAPKVAVDAGLRVLLTGSDAFWGGLRAARAKMAETAPAPGAGREERADIPLKDLRRSATNASEYEKQLREFAGVDLNEL